MSPRRDTIYRKMTRALMGTSLAVIVVTCLSFGVYEYVTFRKNVASALTTRAEIIAGTSAASLAFQNENDAKDVLSVLRSDPHLIAAALYDNRNALFAKFPPSATVPSSPLVDGSRFVSGGVEVYQPVARDGRRLGTVFLKSDLDTLVRRFRFYALLVSVVVAGSLALAFILSIRIRRKISAPILDLAGTARTISVRKDYGLRARKSSDDEIGELTDSFNEMVERIQERDSALRKTQREVESLNVELEQRVRDRTAALEVANQELEAFSYSVSHDLRAPLRAIDGFSQAVLEDSADRLDETGKRNLQRVRAGAQRMGELIDDLLSLSRVSRQALARTRVDLSALAAEAFASLARSEPDRVVAFQMEQQIEAEADEGLIRIVLQNLIGNAWKFTSKREAARIDFGVENGNGSPRFFVRDNGAGFEMAYANKLFGAFQRLHGAGEFPGTGIGLATVARIIHRHGGEVGAESRVGEGATFWFTL